MNVLLYVDGRQYTDPKSLPEDKATVIPISISPSNEGHIIIVHIVPEEKV